MEKRQLVKVRAWSEQYLKNEAALEAYLVDGGIDEARLRLAGGEELAAADLRRVVDEAHAVGRLLDALHSRYNRSGTGHACRC